MNSNFTDTAQNNHFFTMDDEAIGDFIGQLPYGSIPGNAAALEKVRSSLKRDEYECSEAESELEVNAQEPHEQNHFYAMEAKAIDDFVTDLQNGTLGSGSDTAAADAKKDENPFKRPRFNFESAPKDKELKDKEQGKAIDDFMRDLQNGTLGSSGAAAAMDEAPAKSVFETWVQLSQAKEYDAGDTRAEAEESVKDRSVDGFSKRNRDEYEAPEEDSEDDIGATEQDDSTDLREKLCYILELDLGTTSDKEIIQNLCEWLGSLIANMSYVAEVNEKIEHWKQTLGQVPGVAMQSTADVAPVLDNFKACVTDQILKNYGDDAVVETFQKSISDFLDYNFGDTVDSVVEVVDELQAPPAGVNVVEDEKTEAVDTAKPNGPAERKDTSKTSFTTAALLYSHEKLGRELRSGEIDVDEYLKGLRDDILNPSWLPKEKK